MGFMDSLKKAVGQGLLGPEAAQHEGARQKKRKHDKEKKASHKQHKRDAVAAMTPLSRRTTTDPGEETRLARSRAIESAAKRFSFRQTVATSPLGLQGPGAQLGKKRLLGA